MRELGVVSKKVWHKMLQIAQELDLNKGGIYDARLAAINIWVSPEDKPEDWTFPITKGALNFPREFIAAIYGEYVDNDNVKLHLEVTNYARMDYAEQRFNEEFGWEEYERQIGLAKTGTEAEWRWAVEKAKWLMSQAEKENVFADIVYCPFCGQEFKELKLFNDFIEHLTTHVTVKSIIITSEGHVIETSKGTLHPDDYIKTIKDDHLPFWVH